MGILDRVMRTTGLYDNLQPHFFDAMVVPFATIGQINAAELRFLARITRNLEDDGPIVEIGALFGRTALMMAANKKENQRLITVDDFSWNPCGFSPDQHRRITRSVLADAVEGLDVDLLDMEKQAFYDGYDGPPPAMVFLDAMHSYEATLQDITWAQSVGAKVICGHDYCADWPGVIQSVDESGGVAEIVESLWLLKDVRQD